MIFVIKGNKRLCQDKKWREFAHFGTFGSCVKVYKRRARAEQIATSQNALLAYHKKEQDVKVAEVPSGYTVNAVGDVFDASDNRVGTLTDFTKQAQEQAA
jgi:hypothetical protein